MIFPRTLTFPKFKTSAFLFGPRLTGKTTILRGLDYQEYFDLLDPSLELEYKTHPAHFWQHLSAVPSHTLIVIDEIQKIPSLLNYVQMDIDQGRHHFLLSGSSARKLKRGGANLLGGRALDLKIHPLTHQELKGHFSIQHALSFGTLPKIYALLEENHKTLARQHLNGYVSIYLKEEIQAEALTRNLGAFNRFLIIAAQNNGQVIEFSNISRECAVPASTVKEYYQILEDTLLGFYLWPFGHSERKKARPKFYFFDCGVVRAIQNRLSDPPTSAEQGYLFETWFINELTRFRDYSGKSHQFSFWREGNQEIDIVISDSAGPLLALECKSGNVDIRQSAIQHFQSVFPNVPLIVASLTDTRPRKMGSIEVLPWASALRYCQEKLC